ncbi:NAD-dependent epimerase/dehydratase family protein [Bradyrhizobium sp. CB2312]|uniref:SDR family oxidoreductase n=1 Tax=Bradyrhizobium sp. CB2312 TaxID=3039155 RepID=UPI0024B06558|nr:NAD-dependent epimerase/dehydratase family protein [Bradyrhizobium sp. CB2312]WFU72728.1 NAD-dependent epimerase/dehydratase family protein [Bradyrhizobium sp. CB2312]
MTLTLVTGGTGHLGRDIVDRLVRDGRPVRVLARSRGTRSDVEWAIGDLATGAGLREALHDADTVINAATYSPIARRGWRSSDRLLHVALRRRSRGHRASVVAQR